MSRVRQAGRWFANFVEVYLPIGVFVMLFLAFLTNVFFRYVVRNPQNWTFELSVNAFVIVGLVGACAAYRREDHVVFDLLYARVNAKAQNILRMISYGIVILFFGIALPHTIWYLVRLPSVTSIMGIPDRYIFAALPILMLSTVLRSAYRLVQDIKAFRNRSYLQTYNRQEKDVTA